MNKTAIKNFAVWARRKLIADITYKAGMLGITEKGIAKPLPQSTKDLQLFDIGVKDPVSVAGADIRARDLLVSAITEKAAETNMKSAFEFVVEKVAYTWFNRLIAIRFMEINDYLPSHIRVLSSESAGKAEPDIVTTPFETDLPFTTAEADAVQQMKDDSRLDELFRILFIKQCRKLHDILPYLFEVTDSYAEMLLTISFTDNDGIVRHLVTDIPEEYFNVQDGGQVENIGWLYQYWNTEPKDQVFANLKKNIKISKDAIPAATQLFTPDWIVKYMVENSLGRIFVEWNVKDGTLSEEDRVAAEQAEADRMGWKYYLPEAAQEPEVREQLTALRKDSPMSGDLSELKVIDPCMGSGHILCYLFDVLMQIYESQGWTQRDAAQSILTNNLYGLDIDDRAAQLAYFSVMMKARQYDRRIFTRGLRPNVLALQDSAAMPEEAWGFFGPEEKIARHLHTVFADAKEYGSILNITVHSEELTRLRKRMAEMDHMADYGSLASQAMTFKVLSVMEPIVTQAEMLLRRYSVTVTNPPYMGSSGMSAKLSAYVKDHYPDSKSDLFAVFIERCGDMTAENGYQAMITQHAWMFLSSFEKLRDKLLARDTVSMAHLGARAFEEIGGEVVQTTSFILRNNRIKGYRGSYARLVEPNTQQGKEDMYLAGQNRYIAQQDNFSKIPGASIAYWVSSHFLSLFGQMKISDVAEAKSGMTTTDNTRFLRLWFEIERKKMSFDYDDIEKTVDCKFKWYPFCKGGDFRRWTGNESYVINWYDNGKEIRKAAQGATGGRLVNIDCALRECLVWTKISSGSFSLRKKAAGCFFSDAAPGLFYKEKANYILGLLNTKVASEAIKIINPTINFVPGAISSVPYIENRSKAPEVDEYVEKCLCQSKTDWDSFETSWDFKLHPLLDAIAKGGNFFERGNIDLAECWLIWKQECEDRFNQLKANEEELNRIFINIYGLQDELTPEVEDKDVTVRKADLTRDIKSLISYAVGCMFGRYSLDEEGLAYAGGEWDRSKYHTYVPDDDNCLPITDEDYGLKDDVVNRFVDFIRVVYGEPSLETNLKFIADALGNTGTTPRETIRKYFLTDFFKDHCQTYSVTGSGKRPIYWLFDSGKQNGFKALVYMHRWTADTVGNMRVEYLHRMQKVYESQIELMQDAMDHAATTKERTAASKRRDKLTKQLKETRDYDAKIAHIALTRPTIDLDDGVKVNYEKVQRGPDGKSLGVLAKI